MTRTSGATNKPKKVGDIVAKLQSVAEKNGLKISPALKEELIKLSPEEVKKKLDEFSNLELQLEDEEVDTYSCGNCKAVLASALPVCPECGASLKWG